MSKYKRVVDFVFILFILTCLVLLNHWVDAHVFKQIALLTGKRIQSTWPGYLRLAVFIGLAVFSTLWLLVRWILPSRLSPAQILQRLRQRFAEPDDLPQRWHFSWVDGLVLAVFFLYGLALFLDKIQGPYPYIRFDSDAGNIASFAAAQQHPDLFRRDAILSNPANLASYSTVNIPILNLLKTWTGNYALAFAWFILPQTFVNLFGFYVLGLVLFGKMALSRRRFWAFLLAMVLAVPYEINLLETWGITEDPVSRFTFQSILPYLLALIIVWRGKPRRWPWLAVLPGLLAFVHPVSTPAWAAAIWLGLLGCLPDYWTWRKKALVMVGLGALMGVALTPYAIKYLGGSLGQHKPLSYDLFVLVIERYFPANIMNIPAAFNRFVHVNWVSGLLPVSLLLLVVLLILPWRDRAKIRLALLWLVGILFVSLVVPWVEHGIERAYRIVPIETELVRGLRYVVFFMLLFTVWSLAEIDHRLVQGVWNRIAPGPTAIRFAAPVLALGLAVGWLFAADTQNVVPRHLAACLSTGKIVCVSYDDDDLVIQAVARQTPPGEAIFTAFTNQGRMSYGLPIRYLALRSLVFTYKDRGQLVTAHSPALEEWYTRLQEMGKINTPDLSAEEKLDRYLVLARQWKADYMVIDFKVRKEYPQSLGLKRIYENETYEVFQVQ